MDRTRTVSKWTFGCVFFLILLLLSVADGVLIAVIEFKLGRESVILGACLTPLVTGLNTILSRLVTVWVLKRLGMSRSGKTLEIRVRADEIPEGDDEVVEVRRPPSLGCVVWGSIGTNLLVALLITLMLPSLPREVIGFSCLLIAFFALFPGFLGWSLWRNRDRTIARADAGGILGHAIGRPIRPCFIPWSEVATCEIETEYDMFGSLAVVRLTFKDAGGKALMGMTLSPSSEDDQRMMNSIRARLPKTQEDFWE